MVPQDCFELRLLNFAPKSLKGVTNWALHTKLWWYWYKYRKDRYWNGIVPVEYRSLIWKGLVQGPVLERYNTVLILLHCTVQQKQPQLTSYPTISQRQQKRSKMSAKARARFFGNFQVLLPGLGAAAGAAVRRLVQRRSEAPEVPQLVPGFPADRNSLEGSGLDAVTG